MSESERSIILRVESSKASVPLVRAALRGLAGEAGLSEELIGRLELCAAEAVNNCIDHAYANTPGREIRVVWTHTPEFVEISVCDDGAQMDPARLDRAGPGDLEVNPDDPGTLEERGRGLALMKHLMHDVSYEQTPDGNRLRLQLHLDITGRKSTS